VDGLQIRQRIARALPAARRLIRQNIKAKRGVIQNPLAVEQRPGRNSQRRRNRTATKRPIAGHGRPRAYRRWFGRMLVGPPVRLRWVVPREFAKVVCHEGAVDSRNELGRRWQKIWNGGGEARPT